LAAWAEIKVDIQAPRASSVSDLVILVCLVSFF
jgi:hypothetical protein